MEELIELKNFRKKKEEGKGYIAITDKNLPKNCVHHTSCYEVKEIHFKQKVINSNRRNGTYYFTDDPNEALRTLDKMTKCEKCF